MDPVGPDPGGPEGGGPAEGPDPVPSASPPEPSSEPVAGEATGAAASASASVGADADAPTTVIETPVHVDTDAAVDTEAVEPPPVQIATVDRPAGPRRVSSRAAGLIAVIGILAIAAVGYAGYSLNQDLTATRSNLATTQGDLGSTKSSLDDTTANLTATTKDVADASAERADLDEQIKGLSAQVATQTECVTLQKAALAELIRISSLQTTNFNRTAQGSAWDTAEKKRADGITVALDEFYTAYSAAFQGSSGTAKAHADTGKAAQAKIAEAEKQLVAELQLVDAKAAEIQAAIDALEKKLTETEATCEGVAP
jgi:peptidoglycan hydrolase CwlO-like protein